MNKLPLLVLTSLFASASYAATPANSYECSGLNASASFVTQGFLGPSLRITLSGKTFKAQGLDIRNERTVLGQLVTLTTEQVPDAYTDTLTLMAPDVNVSGFGATTKFQTRLFKTRTFTSIGGPSLVNGVIQDNRSVLMQCEATALAF
jgi:hypothetical protein